MTPSDLPSTTPTTAQPEKPARRPYSKPSIVRVELRAEEAVLGACKTASTAGPASPQCATLACSAIAS